mgnify:CR=1 FL=1
MKVYLTHCSATKNDSLKGTQERVTPDKLYTSERIQAFMRRCKEKKVNWAIFSDLYGIWFPWEKHTWYDMDPNEVTQWQFLKLVSDFENKLQDYDEIHFYHNPARFHQLYQTLLQVTRPRGRVKLISHIEDINP